MTKSEFDASPQWKQTEMKKERGLFQQTANIYFSNTSDKPKVDLVKHSKYETNTKSILR